MDPLHLEREVEQVRAQVDEARRALEDLSGALSAVRERLASGLAHGEERATGRVTRPDVSEGPGVSAGEMTSRVTRPDVSEGPGVSAGEMTSRVTRPDVSEGPGVSAGEMTSRVTRPDVSGSAGGAGGGTAPRRETKPLAPTDLPPVGAEVQASGGAMTLPSVVHGPGDPEGDDGEMDGAQTGTYKRPQRDTQTYFFKPDASQPVAAHAGPVAARGGHVAAHAGDATSDNGASPPDDSEEVSRRTPAETLDIVLGRDGTPGGPLPNDPG